MDMKKYKYQDKFEYTVVKSKRKTLGIVIKAGGEVLVKAPSFLSDNEIAECIAEKEDWILKKLPEMVKYADKVPQKTYETGETLFFLGKPFQLVRKPSLSARKGSVKMAGDSIIVYGNFNKKEDIRAVLEIWYQEKAEEWITRRMEFYSRQIGVEYRRIRFSNPRTRWGSCSSQKNIMINWKLIMAPIEIIDYVVCHELCHIREMNHSKAFWELVEKEIPDWKERRNWLKENGMTLAV